MSKSDKTRPFTIDTTQWRWTHNQPNGQVVPSKREFTNLVRFGPNTPGWQSRIRWHADATTSMTGVKVGYNRQTSSAVVVYSNPALFARAVGASSADQLAVHPFDGSLDSQAVAAMSRAFLASYRKSSQQLPGLVTFGEIGKTLRGLRSPVKSLRRGIDNLISGYHTNLRKFRKNNRVAKPVDKASLLLHAFTDTWLEWSFGIKPTISDIEGASRSLAVLSESPERAQPISVIGDGRAESSRIDPVEFFFAGLPTMGDALFVEVQSASYRQKGQILSSSSSYPTVMDTLGLTIREFVPSMWELVPFSFLVDYFVNVSDVIDAWSYQNMHLSWCYRTARTERYVAATNLVSRTPPAGQKWYPAMGGSTLRITDVHRRKLETAELDWHLSFTIPGLGMKWINIASLASSYTGLKRDIGRVLKL